MVNQEKASHNCFIPCTENTVANRINGTYIRAVHDGKVRCMEYRRVYKALIMIIIITMIIIIIIMIIIITIIIITMLIIIIIIVIVIIIIIIIINIIITGSSLTYR